MFDVDVDVPITFVDLGFVVHLVRRIPFFLVDAFLLEWPGDVVTGETALRWVSLPTRGPQVAQVNVTEHGRRHGPSVADHGLFGIQEPVEVRARLFDFFADMDELFRRNVYF